jgi:hypothetical protein
MKRYADCGMRISDLGAFGDGEDKVEVEIRSKK